MADVDLQILNFESQEFCSLVGRFSKNPRIHENHTFDGLIAHFVFSQWSILLGPKRCVAAILIFCSFNRDNTHK